VGQPLKIASNDLSLLLVTPLILSNSTLIMSEPLHMRDVDDDVPVLPANITTSEEKNAMYVDMKEDSNLSNASISESLHPFWFYQL